jgi:hypothetical protein
LDRTILNSTILNRGEKKYMTDRRQKYYWPRWAEVNQNAEAEMPEGVMFVMGVIFLGIVLAALKYLWPGVIAVVVIYNLYHALTKLGFNCEVQQRMNI